MNDADKKPQIFIATERYPYGDSEAPFIEPELGEILKNYEVTFISHMCDGNCDKVTNNKIGKIRAYNIDIKFKWYDKVIYFIRFLLDIDGRKEIGLIIREKEDILRRIYQSAGFYALAMQSYKIVSKSNIFPKDEEFIYYSYWYYYYTYGMTKHRNEYPNMKIITRAHGFDLYDERYIGNRQPFKAVMDPNIDRIAFISEHGRDYYLRKYKLADSSKYSVNRLGSRMPEFSCESKENGNKSFRVVSCSSLISLKRVNLIIEALNLLHENIEWIHFGDGIELENILRLAEELLDKKINISYMIRGFTPNKEILEYYKTNYVNCFISTSSSEGLPVSIQEALAFEIPIIATDVGGVSELIEGNGILLSQNPTPQEIANAICNIMYLDKEVYRKWRENSYKIWNEKCNAEVNSNTFVEVLKGLWK